MKEINWSKGPSDATHWGPDTALYHECFYKKDGEAWLFAAEHTEWSWSDCVAYPIYDEERLHELVEKDAQ
jgi:hypothetical protein